MTQRGEKCPNESELRAKVIDLWLRDHGFTINQISLERSFTISLGRGSRVIGSEVKRQPNTARGRADYLVKSIDGRNLFIIEAKAPGEPVDEASRIQALSYARLLRDGGIAPFAIVTNGVETVILDSITGAPLNGESIPIAHPYVRTASASRRMTYLADRKLLNISSPCQSIICFHFARLKSNFEWAPFAVVPSLAVSNIYLLFT